MTTKNHKLRLSVFLFFSFSSLFVNAESNQSEDSFIIVGAAITPEYMGSEDNQVVPMVVSEFTLANKRVVIEGLDIDAYLFQWGKWNLGLATNFDTGRDTDIDDDVVARLEELDIATNMGLALTYKESDSWKKGDELEFSIKAYGDVSDTHNGSFVTTGLSYALPLYIPWRFEFELETTYADSQYMSTYFGVSDAGSVASGLSTYKPDSGFRDVSLATNIGFFLNPKWGVFARISATRLLGEAADSPIVDRGDKNQYFVGLGLYYRF